MMILAPFAATLSSWRSPDRENTRPMLPERTYGKSLRPGERLQKLDAYSRRLPMPASPSTGPSVYLAPPLSGASLAICFLLIRQMASPY